MFITRFTLTFFLRSSVVFKNFDNFFYLSRIDIYFHFGWIFERKKKGYRNISCSQPQRYLEPFLEFREGRASKFATVSYTF